MKYIALVIISFLFTIQISAQRELDLEGIELQFDQDYLADFLRKKEDNESNPFYGENYTTAMRIGIYGAYANSYYLGLPWLRERIDFVADNILYRGDFREKQQSHNFVFTMNGFSPSHISAETDEYDDAVNDGYSLAEDRPFSTFLGFRSSRRLVGTKRFVHSAKLFDVGFNTSFAFGLGGTGIGRGIDKIFGINRPDGTLWKRDESVPYPTGEVIKNVLPVFLYSVSSEIAVWSPFRKFVIQVRPELNLGTYTDVAFGIDLGKVMSVEPVIDNLSYTDINNPSLAVVNDDSMGFSLVGGATIRAVLYNYHLNGVYGRSKGNYYSFTDTRKFVFESYVGLKLQVLQSLDITYSINWRSSEIKSDWKKNVLWGTIGVKYLMGPAGVGCYD